MADGFRVRMAAMARALAQGVRHLFRDDAYERYLAEQRRAQPDAPPMDRPAFKKAQALRGLGRCCGG